MPFARCECFGFGRGVGFGFGVGLGVVVVVVDVVSVVSVVDVDVVSVVDVVRSAGRATERPAATDAVTTPAAARQHRSIASATRLTRGSVSPALRVAPRSAADVSPDRG